MVRFRETFSLQLGMICLELREGLGAKPSGSGELAQKLSEWERLHSVPGLASHVYFWTAKTSSDSLIELTRQDGRLQSKPSTPQLKRLLHFLNTIPPSQPLVSVPHHMVDPRLQGYLHNVGGFDQNIAVLAVPFTPSSGLQTKWLLVQLNAEALQKSVFPRLAARYFSDTLGADYDLAVMSVGGRNRSVLYSSNQELLQDGISDGDSSLNLFGQAKPDSSGSFSPLESYGTSYIPKRWNASTADNGHIQGPIRFEPIHHENGEGDWRIVVRHRNGSLAVMVAAQRKRNLTLSLGVLLVLAASMALIIVNSNRARRLAGLQMDFVTGVSHELRTPVAAILSVSDNIASGIVTEKQQFLAYGEMIRNQARHLNVLIEQVLRFSAIQRIRKYTPQRMQISEVVDDALESTAVLVASSGTQIQKTIEPNLPTIYADFNALSQCLENLITNAVKYGGDSKWVRISAAQRNSDRASHIEISVEDHGIGIEPEHLKYIFDPFYRSPKVAESKIHGSGLGLALAKSYVEAMDGSITVKSRIGEGTIFEIHFPIKDEQHTGTVQDEH